mmetsp:Transcript_2408/g.3776  ORF Transcript_2408/g.3776 Transcript_2408/m.3776 type:complete len:263 (-) Transcript_2408:278-1066(-)
MLSMKREVLSSTWLVFILWTTVWWGGVVALAGLFFVGMIDFPTSTKTGLYGVSIWLNGWIIPLLMSHGSGRSRLDVWHECLVVWLISYMMTNALWEIPWLILSPFVFKDLHTLDDVLAQTDWMRESLVNMYWWVLASFSAVDLRTVNHNSTFYTLELYSFINVPSTFYFLYLNKKQSPYRYLIPVIGCGEPIMATFIFTFSEVFCGYENMPGGVADTLLALVWTQYQYFFFPMIFGYIGFELLLEDWRHTNGLLAEIKGKEQ